MAGGRTPERVRLGQRLNGPSDAQPRVQVLLIRRPRMSRTSSTRPRAPQVGPLARRGLTVVVPAMLVCLGAVAVLAFLDSTRESSNALSEFAQQQAVLARSLGLHVSARLAQARRDLLVIEGSAARGAALPAELADAYRELRPEVPASTGLRKAGNVPWSVVTDGLVQLELPMQVLVLLRPPGGGLWTTDGRPAASPAVERALEGRGAYVRLDPEQANALGLAARTAMVGLAHVEGGSLGHWDVAVASSAENLRDRERWAHWRLVLTVVAASALVFLFGGIALRNQRRELDAAHALVVARLDHAQEDRLQEAAREATLGTLAIGLAHEICTPLGVISARAEQLRDRVQGDDRGERAVASILDQAEGIGRVIKGLLNLARGDAPQFSPVDPGTALEAAAEMTAHKFSATDVELRLVPSTIDAFVQGDPRLLQQAIVNLLLNAWEASPRGGTVTASLERTGSELQFVIRDEGPGISDQDVLRAGSPFFSPKSDDVGSGLGLAIAHEIATSHRGTLTLQRLRPRGTRAAINLPVVSRASSVSAGAPGGADVHASGCAIAVSA
jgi:two-component system NtrC family sensor kinase